MAKSKARFLAEILGSDGKVQKGKSKGFEQIALSDLPTITNAKLQNSAVTFAGETASLGGSASLNTGDITEHTNYKYYTDARSRGSISASLASGHGAVSYNSTTGALSITGVSTEAIQDVVGAMFSSNTESGITVTYDDSDGTIDLSVTALNTDSVSEGSSNLYHTTARARAAISATGSLSYNSSTGVMSFTMPAQNTSNITEGSNLYFTNARADARIAAADTGDLSEGSNLYYTNARADARIAAADTGDLSEGSNLYFTNARADARITNAGSANWNTAYGWGNHASGGYAPLAGPALTGTPTAPTAAANTNTTQIATTAYVQTELTDLIDGAPGTLDSLNELAAAINDDSNYNSTLTTALATKVNKTSNQALGNAANVMTISGNTITLARGDSTTDTVTVPDTNTTYTAGTNMSLTGTTFASTDTTYTTATSSALGLVKIGYTESGKNYPVELDSGKMYVNVPWVDTNTNTTYTGGTNISLSGTTFNLDNQIVLSTGIASTKGAFGTGQTGVHATYHLYNNSLTYLNGNTIIDANLNVTSGGLITANRIITTGLYGTGHGSSMLPIWQYNASHHGYGFGYVEGSPDSFKFDVSNNLVSGTPDFEISENVARVNGNTVWHAGNDGAGSGLDADTLDGLQVHTTQGSQNTANTILRTQNNGYAHLGWINTSSGVTTSTINKIYSSNDDYIRYVTPATFISQLGLFTTSNDGSGSGLDADTVDGVQLSGLARLGHDNAGEIRGTNFKALNGGVYYAYTSAGNLRGYMYATDTNDEHLVLRTSGGEDIAFKDDTTTNMIVRGDGTMWLRDNLDMGGDLNLGTSGTGNTLNAKYGQIIGGFGAITTGGTTDWNHSTNARSGSGHTLLYGNATNGPDSSLSGKYYHPFSFEYASYDGDGNMAQFAIPYAHNDAGPYFRTRYGGTWGGWVELWHSGNDGASSGLDADNLDGSTWGTQTKAVAARNLTIEAGEGQGIGFWGGTGTVLGGSYAIAMASQGNGNAGRHSLDSTSDYNMYFKMSGGTDRGFVFKNSGTNVAAITKSGRFLGSAVYLDGSASQNQYVGADSTHSLTIRNMGHTDYGGLVLQGSDGTHGIQMYFDGSGANYGFLDAAWGAWDIQKIKNGTFKVDEGSGLKRVLNEANWSSYISVPSSSTFATLSGSNSFTNVYNEFGNNTGAVSNDGSWNARVNISGTSHARLDLFEDADDSKLRLYVHTGNAARIDTVSNTDLHIGTNGQPRIQIDNTGYVQFNSHTNSWDGGIRLVSNDGTDTYQIHPDNNGYMYIDKTWYFTTAPHVGSIGNHVWHVGNDGSGSTLDADLLDGQHGSYYRSASNLNAGTVPTGQMPKILPTTGNYQWSASTAASGYSPVGISTSFVRSSDGWPEYGTVLHVGGRGGSDAGGDFQLFSGHGAANGGNYLRVRNADNSASPTDSWTAFRTIWDSGNDGSGSGLDADLLDGNQASAFLAAGAKAADSNILDGLDLHTGRNNEVNKVVRTDSNGYIQAGWINTTSGALAVATDLARVYCSDDGYLRYMTLKHFKVKAGLSGQTDYDRQNYTSGDAYMTGANSHNDVTFNELLQRGCGFIDNWNSGAGKPPSGSHYNGFQAMHYASGSSYFHGMQMAMSAGNPGVTYLRGWWANGGSGYGWQKIWTDGNDGSGSGLDADLLDGIDSTYFNRGTNTSGVFPGSSGHNLNDVFTSTPRAGFIDAWSGSNFPPGTTHIQGLQVRHNTSTHYGWQLFGQYNQAGKLYHRQVSNNSWGSWSTMWSSGNDGSGSGLDADLLDGMNSAASGNSIIMRTETNGYSQLNNWTQVGGSGLYSSSINGSHWYPNTLGSYGSWRLAGSRGGYSGILHDNGGDVVGGMYDSAGNGGDWNGTNGWQWYWHRSNSCLAVAGSTTSSSYSLYVGGAIYATGDVVGSSDRRLKKNINTIENGLAKVEKLRGVTYEWKDSKESGSEGNNVTPERMGVIAQEIIDIVPEVVTHDKENDRYGVSYGHLTGVLIEAIKELSDKVKELEKKLEEK